MEVHLERVLAYLVEEYAVASLWLPILLPMLTRVASSLIPKMENLRDPMDVRYFVKLKPITGNVPSASTVIDGLVFDGNRTHRRMRVLSLSLPPPFRRFLTFSQDNIVKPTVLLVGCDIEYQAPPAILPNSLGAGNNKSMSSQLTSLTDVMSHEASYLSRVVDAIVLLKPDVVFVQGNVARHAQNLLLQRNITLVTHVKKAIMHVLSRICRTPLVAALSSLVDPITTSPSYAPPPASSSVGDASAGVRCGTCGRIYIQTYALPIDKRRQIRLGRPTGLKSCIYVAECPPHLFSTVILRGVSDATALRALFLDAIYTAYHLHLEKSYLHLLPLALPSIPTTPLPTLSLVQLSPTGSALPLSPYVMYQSVVDSLDQSRNSRPVPRPHLTKAPTAPNLLVTSTLAHDSIDTFEGDSVVGLLELKFDYRSVLASTSAPQSVPRSQATAMSLPFQERLVYVHSLCCTSSSALCIPHELHFIEYYTSNDLSLGQYLRWFCFDDKLTCRAKGCGRDMLDHARSFLHHQGRLNVTVKEWIETSTTGSAVYSFHGDTNAIGVWHRCPVAVTVKPVFCEMDAASLRLSFGRFLELYFYSRDEEQTCRHCHQPFHRHTRLFMLSGKVAIFEYETLTIHKIVPPHHSPPSHPPLPADPPVSPPLPRQESGYREGDQEDKSHSHGNGVTSLSPSELKGNGRGGTLSVAQNHLNRVRSHLASLYSTLQQRLHRSAELVRVSALSSLSHGTSAMSLTSAIQWRLRQWRS